MTRPLVALHPTATQIEKDLCIKLADDIMAAILRTGVLVPKAQRTNIAMSAMAIAFVTIEISIGARPGVLEEFIMLARQELEKIR